MNQPKIDHSILDLTLEDRIRVEALIEIYEFLREVGPVNDEGSWKPRKDQDERFTEFNQYVAKKFGRTWPEMNNLRQVLDMLKLIRDFKRSEKIVTS